MTEATNTALALRWFDDVWNQRRESTIEELMAPDAVGHLEGLTVRGVAEFVAARGYLIGAFPDFHITVEETVAEGDSVVLRWVVTGTHTGGNLGIPATGKAVRFRGLTWFRFAGGRIVEGWDSWNQGGLMQELNAAGRSA